MSKPPEQCQSEQDRRLDEQLAAALAELRRMGEKVGAAANNHVLPSLPLHIAQIANLAAGLVDAAKASGSAPFEGMDPADMEAIVGMNRDALHCSFIGGFVSAAQHTAIAVEGSA